MDQFEVFYTSKAIADLISIHNYIVEEYQDLQYAVKLNTELKAFIHKLEFMPNRYRVYEEEFIYFGFIVRVAVYKKYYILYAVNEVERKVTIFRIVSCKVNVPKWLTL